MSLLMKALEKAARDREEARNEPAVTAAAEPAAAPAATPSRSELSLEPIGTEAPAAAPAPKPEPAPRPAAAPSRAAPAATSARDPAQARAARRLAAGGASAYVSSRPVVAFGLVAGLVAAGFGIYVYLQIFHSALFLAQPAAPKGPLQPLTRSPAPPPAPGAILPAEPLPAAPLLREAAAEAAPAATTNTARAQRQPAAEAPRNAVSVSRGSSAPVLNPLHVQAYAALQAGRMDEALYLYSQLVGAEPGNVDALLALAAIAAQRRQVEEAVQRYLQILELEPRHALAQSGLIALLGRADPVAAETKLRQLIAREPSAHLHFTLGNLYADQSQWAAAQHAYFQAHHLEPANPDYAYNLAVALEHVSQPKPALGFYRRAVELAAARGRANFSLPQAQERIGKLVRQVE